MSWADQISNYCERVGPGLWAEPANTLSNLGYVAAAVALWRLQARLSVQSQTIPADLRLLAPLLSLVALGSFLFHTLATRWAGTLDTLLILLFCCAFLYSFLRHVASASNGVALASAAAFAVISYAVSRAAPPETLNGSLGYTPNLIALIALSVYLAHRRAAAARIFGCASVLFCVALVLRTLDRELCARFALGTHFLWHLLTAAVLWMLSRELLVEQNVQIPTPTPATGR